MQTISDVSRRTEIHEIPIDDKQHLLSEVNTNPNRWLTKKEIYKYSTRSLVIGARVTHIYVKYFSPITNEHVKSRKLLYSSTKNTSPEQTMHVCKFQYLACFFVTLNNDIL